MKSFIHFTQPLFGDEEKKEINDALDSGWVTLGPRVKQFEDEFALYAGVKHAVALSSCTAGLHLALLAAGIKPGEEVITTPFTFVATTNTIIQIGAIPVLVDIDEKSFNIDISKIEEKIGNKTKAILPVHYGGLSVDMDGLLKIAKKYKLTIIVDAAHGTGGSFKSQKIGISGDMTCFSFHPVKNMSTGDGGMVTTNNDEYADKLRILRLHGMSKDAWKRHTASGTWKYDIETPGFKYNMTDVSAALGIHQLRKLDGFIAKRKEYAAMYDKSFTDVPEIEIPYTPENDEHIYSLYTIKIDCYNLKISRDEIVEELKKANIGVSVYFIPVHYFTYYKNRFGFKKGDYPVTESVFDKVISLPLYPRMTESQVSYVADTLKKIISKNRKEYHWDKDKFDSEIFGLNVAKIKYLHTNGESTLMKKNIISLLKELKENKINYATHRVSSSDFALIQELEDNNFKLVDGLISLKTQIDNISLSESKMIREADLKDIDDLKKLASSVFYLNRVYNDSFLDKKKANKMYEKWIENSLNKSVADIVLVYEEDQKILGFITIQKNGHIPLMGVDKNSRGKGMAKKLINAAFKRIQKWGGRTSYIETQMANIPALRAYQSCGFKIIESHLTFRWINE